MRRLPFHCLLIFSLFNQEAFAFQPFSKIEEYCIHSSANKFGLPSCLIKSLLIQEGGTPGEVTVHSNGQKDIGRGQINHGGAWFNRLLELGITEDMLLNNPCANIAASAFILSSEINLANGNIVLGIGNYHRGYRKNLTPARLEYAKGVINRYSTLKESRVAGCR